MKNHSSPRIAFSALASLFLAAAPARAAVTFLNGFTGSVSEVNSTSELAYAANVSSTDLLNGKVPAITGWNLTNGAHPNELTDGVHGATFAAAGNLVDGGWTTVGATATYDLGGGANGLGYDITSLQSIAAWVDVRFGNQAWTVAVRPVGSISFTDLATINYQPLTAGGATQVSLTGLNVTGVNAIRFTALQVNGGTNAGAFVPREIDVFGASTVPEPGAALLGALGTLLLVKRRRVSNAR
ncbi:hypothetical protein OKA04_15720 [Luteolibacter flavescens]|uniref:PEP-CTERM sorting domain-containing protein n=1 Tax=Luteolibacter flavescens TaxID=1859460 RepID=A0ABT3FRG4_9BACT|nr:hypothetical protein [Luteolibacter flavescens]MCW1886186.1 hypothetical protein [Luteolibacter flavescens]